VEGSWRPLGRLAECKSPWLWINLDGAGTPAKKVMLQIAGKYRLVAVLVFIGFSSGTP
jgi:hypothetical protein